MTPPRLYTPTLPPFQAEHGQCLPAAVAILFNEPQIIAAFPGKKFGYLLAQIGKMLPEGVSFDVLYADSSARNGGFAIDRETKTLNETDFLPVFVQIGNHVVLYLANRFGHVYGFDLLSNRCGLVPRDKFLTSKIDAAVCLADPVTNSVFGIAPEDLPHLLK